jgi:preprotein translocase subunit SecA
MVVALGGLHIVGTERHEARRIDNQLRGRAGRQGDPGGSRFYVSLEDEIIRRFSGDRVKNLMEWAGLQDDVPIEHGMVNKAIENAQVKVESYNFDLRKHLVEFDDVINTQRDVIYTERLKILSGADLRANVVEMVEQELEGIIAALAWREARNGTYLRSSRGVILPVPVGWNEVQLSRLNREIAEALLDHANARYEQRDHELGEDARTVERLVMLRILDSLWIEHLTLIDEMRRGIGLRAYGQQDPLGAITREAHAAFENLLAEIRHGIARTIYHTTIARAPVAARPSAASTLPAVGQGVRHSPSLPTGRRVSSNGQAARSKRKIGRYDPCPCGSGRKYKHCHGAS